MSNHIRKLAAALFGATLLAIVGVAGASAQTANVCRNTASPCVTEDFTAVPVSGGTLTSAARTTTQTGSDQEALGYKGVRCVVNVTANPSAVTLTTKIQGLDDVSAAYFDVLSSASAINDTAIHQINIHPGTTAVSGISNGEALPAEWRLLITPGSASSVTYSASCARTP